MSGWLVEHDPNLSDDSPSQVLVHRDADGRPLGWITPNDLNLSAAGDCWTEWHSLVGALCAALPDAAAPRRTS